MKRFAFCIAVSSMLCSVGASADSNGCFPNFTSLDAMHSLDAGKPTHFEDTLRSQNVAGLFDTKVKLIGDFDGHTLSLAMKDFETGPSLIYVLSAMLITDGRDVSSWRDFTNDCQQGARLPEVPRGGSLKLKPVNLAQGRHDIRLLVFGRLN